MPSLPELAPLAAVLVLLELALGTVAVSAALDHAGRVGRGFAGTTAAICVLIMLVDLLVLSGTADFTGALHQRVDAGAVANLAHAGVAFTALLGVDALFAVVGTEVARRVVAGLTVVGGILALAAAAAALGPVAGGEGAVLAVLGSATLLGGSALAGMLLGHWYLVTPHMSFRPLRLAVYTVFAAVAVDCCVIGIGLAAGAAAARQRLLSGDQAFLFWLLVVGSGVLFTSAVNALTLYFARIRANQPATAMLYVLIITVVMALIPAHMLFLLTGVAV